MALDGLFGVGCFWPVLDGDCSFWPDLWINYSCSAMIYMLHNGFI